MPMNFCLRTNRQVFFNAIFDYKYMTTFCKPVKTSVEHIKTWQQRGLNIPNQERAVRYLNYIGYYRLSAYTIPFQDPKSSSHQFKQNVNFDDILSLYIFDRELRLLVMDAIERIEVAIRAQISNVLCNEFNDAFWYLDENCFDQNYQHFRLLANIERQRLEEQKRLKRDYDAIESRKNISLDQKRILKDKVQKENFLRHYLSQYDQPKLPPSWMMIEMLTWGDLSHLYTGVKSTLLRKKIAGNLGLHAQVFESWIKTLNDVRNVCAHHNRLWNKEFGRSIKIPTSKSIIWLQQAVILANPAIHAEKRIYMVLVALQTLLYKISPNSQWAQRLKQLMAKYPKIAKSNMGMPEEWHNDDFWTFALKLK
ncbi:Abi family protein [Testudinibacter sp. TR-2022]|uniref:Abi family protein n=1 Tax=Testudinibacter sp. TR-2022 TaxID=2585029 RepID=UPI00227907B8|nr:Abi family protein [Testudinibacter sp. TR-2022]